MMCPHWHACVSGLVLEERLSVILKDFMALLTLGFVFFYLFSQFVDVFFAQDRTQNNSWSTDNVRPEWPLDRRKISLAGHVDWSRTLPFMNKKPNPHLEIRFWLLLKNTITLTLTLSRFVLKSFSVKKECTSAYRIYNFRKKVRD